MGVREAKMQYKRFYAGVALVATVYVCGCKSEIDKKKEAEPRDSTSC